MSLVSNLSTLHEYVEGVVAYVQQRIMRFGSVYFRNGTCALGQCRLDNLASAEPDCGSLPSTSPCMTDVSNRPERWPQWPKGISAKGYAAVLVALGRHTAMVLTPCATVHASTVQSLHIVGMQVHSEQGQSACTCECVHPKSACLRAC